MSDKDTVKEAAKSESKKAVAKKDKKDGIFSRIGKFFRELRGELKKISWPTWAEVVKNTIITLVVVAVIGLIIGLFDYGVSTLRNWAIDAVQKDSSVGTVVDEIEDDVSNSDYSSPTLPADYTTPTESGETTGTTAPSSAE